MARGVTTVIPRAILATPYGTQRLLERLEAFLASTASGQGASMVGYDNTASGLTGTTLQAIVDELQATSSLPASTTLTIAGGIVTATQSVHAIDTQGAAATDDLDTISGTVAGFYLLRLANAARNVVLKHGTGNIWCPNGMDITLDVAVDHALLYSNGTNLYVVGHNLDAIVPVSLTIAGGIITPTSSNILVDTEAAAATDNLDTISGTAAGQILILGITASARNVVLRHGIDNIYCPGGVNITLDDVLDRVVLVSNGTNLYVVGQELANPAVVADGGSVATASLELSAQPTTADTIAIGADTYQFRAAAESVTNDTFIAVEIAGGGAAATAANLVAAINATYTPNEHPTIFLIDGVTPALANGTEAVVADYIAGTTDVRIRGAVVAGGAVLPSDPNIVLTENIIAASDIWDVGTGTNMNTLAGRTFTVRQHAVTTLTATAAMITAGRVRVDFPFTPVAIFAQARSTAGLIRFGTDTYLIANDGVAVTLTGGGAPDIQDTDIVTIEAWGA